MTDATGMCSLACGSGHGWALGASEDTCTSPDTVGGWELPWWVQHPGEQGYGTQGAVAQGQASCRGTLHPLASGAGFHGITPTSTFIAVQGVGPSDSEQAPPTESLSPAAQRGNLLTHGMETGVSVKGPLPRRSVS